MLFVYIVIEHSDNELPESSIFPTTYTTFNEAKAAAIGKYQTVLNDQIKDADDETKTQIMANVNVRETEPKPVNGVIGTVRANLYIEKGINIYIHKLPVKISGARRRSFLNSKTQRRKIKMLV